MPPGVGRSPARKFDLYPPGPLDCCRPGRRIELCWEATRAPIQGPDHVGGELCSLPSVVVEDMGWHESEKSPGVWGWNPQPNRLLFLLFRVAVALSCLVLFGIA